MIPSGKEMANMRKEKQIFWIKLLLSASQKNLDIVSILRKKCKSALQGNYEKH